MNKLQYKKLLQLRKDQEKLLRVVIEFGFSPWQIIKVTGINHKRIWYLIGKMKDYEYGTCLDNGWIHEKIYANKLIEELEE